MIINATNYDAVVWNDQWKWNIGSMFKSYSGLEENEYELVQKRLSNKFLYLFQS